MKSLCVLLMAYLLLLVFFFFFFFLCVMYNNMVYIVEWEVVSLNSLKFEMLLLFDWMSLLFVSFVLLISSMVIYYSMSYMSGDYNLNRFILLVLLFVVSMLLLIVSPNLVSILLGWDGLGLVSYCLIIYYQNVNSYNCGMLTVLSNRVGDVMILMGVVWMSNFGSWNFMFYLNYLINDDSLLVVGVLMILAAITKSAQIPFSSWLPAAMAAPTPVSALVHSSTLVTAGVYLMIRFYDLFLGTNILLGLLFLASITMFMAGVSANFEFDLKKIIALSTLSQLGLMISILSLGFKNLAFFHLLTHALFKSMLFLCSGMIIHSMGNNQDIRYMGGLVSYMPLLCINFNIGNLALMGFPFLAGFYSKDLILEVCLMSSFNYLMFFMFFVSIGLTVSYSFRLFYYLMFSSFNFKSLFIFHENDSIMNMSIFTLSMMSIIGGALLSWFMLPLLDIIFLGMVMKFMVYFFIFLGILVGGLIFKYNYLLNYLFVNSLFYFLSLMWFLPNLSTFGVNLSVLMYKNKLFKSLDMGWIELLGGQGMMSVVTKGSYLMLNYQINYLKIYLFIFLFFNFLLFFWFILF
uniref:NADH dehydrogenase subunit 5 n=1 Tax=Stenopsyche navasi TaxID=1560150 RepID=UPI0022DCDF67|nr:NADH dehydrogenase subunit 5 [Stenopsyche navasi]UZZ44410.1 NADH dehydrogenase subunit 5 [Stenopsyche navasi]